jgi:hypothetical protein
MESLAVETAEERYYPFDKADDDDDDDEDHQGTSAFVAFVNITKCFAGASSFELPFALMEGGLIAGTLQGDDRLCFSLVRELPNARRVR